jgi:glycerol-3-phosphate cytidylyltransferase
MDGMGGEAGREARQNLKGAAETGKREGMKRGITFGTFDVFHYGHLRILERSREFCDHLTVGVSSDELNFSKKGRMPYYSYEERSRIVGALRCVDEVFKEESLELKAEYVKAHRADVLIMGDDWAGKFDWVKPFCEVVYLPRTPGISTTALIEKIRV